MQNYKIRTIEMWPFASEKANSNLEQNGVVNLNSVHETIQDNHDRLAILTILTFLMILIMFLRMLYSSFKNMIVKKEQKRGIHRSMAELAQMAI